MCSRGGRGMCSRVEGECVQSLEGKMCSRGGRGMCSRGGRGMCSRGERECVQQNPD